MDIVELSEAGEYAVGYTNAGEWMEYTMDVSKAGKYRLTLNAASGSESSSVMFFVDDIAVTDTVKIPKTDSTWNVYKAVDAGTLDLSAGTHVLKMQITGSYVNVDWFEFQDLSDTATTSVVRRGSVSKSGSVLLSKTKKFFDLVGRCVRFR